MPVGSEMDEVLAVSCVRADGVALRDRRASGPRRSAPAANPRSVGAYDLVGISSMATRPLETMAWPVVPAGMFGLGHDGRRAHGGDDARARRRVLAGALHAGECDRAPGDEQDHPDHDQYQCLPLHRTFPLSTDGQRDGDPSRVISPLAPLEGTTGRGATYIGPFDHSPRGAPVEGKWSICPMYPRHPAAQNQLGRITRRPIDMVASRVGAVARDTEEGVPRWEHGRGVFQKGRGGGATTNAERRWSSSRSSSCC